MTSSPSIVNAVPLYFPYITLSPTLRSSGTRSPFSYRPGPTAMTSPCVGFSLAVSGMYNPPRIDSASSLGRMTTRSSSGVMRCLDLLAPAIPRTSTVSGVR